MFGNARLHKLLHESGGKRFVGRKSNRAFSKTISGKFVLVCPGDVIATVSGVVMSLRVDRADDSRNILADVIQDPSLFDCRGSALTAEKLLSEEGTARLGLSEKAFRELVPTGEPGIGEGRIVARFLLYSKYMVSAR